MTKQFDAIYEGGVLRPLVPLEIPDNARVRLSIDTQGDAALVEPRDEWERRLLEVPKDCGVSLPDAAVGSEGLYE